MRKSSPFVAIPTVPTTVSGQWLTYSHMANHYRKLLNVKPRVHSNAPRKASSSAIALQASTMKLCKKMSTKASGPKTMDSASIRSNTALRVIRSVPKVNSYQMVFDQSELNNLSEAVMTDSECEDDDLKNVHQMAISEKINLYLDQLQDPILPDENQSYDSSFINYKSQSATKSNKSSKVKTVDLGRHSRCFMPHVEAEKVKVKPKPLSKSTTLLKPTPPPPKLKNVPPKKAPPPKTTKPVPLSRRGQNGVTLPSNKNPKSKSPIPRISQRNFSSRNSGSIGSVAGSDYLTEKRYPSLVSETRQSKPGKTKTGNRGPLSIGRNPELDDLLLRGSILPPNWISEGQNPPISVSNNRQRSNVILTTVPPGYVNKDSSRDSAYGFSSGESKITTRESTPEKRKRRMKEKVIRIDSKCPTIKYKSNLSTVASSINQESLSEPVQLIDQQKHTITSNRELKKASSSILLTTDKYINFITAVTDDIIKREVFTNKGLKSLFTAHVEANRDLDTDKMIQMLDRLRMDVGIPKDDSLNQMEFGYGSIKYSTTAFFPKYTQLPDEGCERSTGKYALDLAPTSDTSIRQIHAPEPGKSFHSGDESSRMSSCSVSVANENLVEDAIRILPKRQESDDTYRDEIPSRDSGSSPPSSQASSAALSLTESQIQRTLGEAGFTASAALEIARITKHGHHHRHRQRSKPAAISLTQEPNNNKPLDQRPSSIHSSSSLEDI